MHVFSEKAINWVLLVGLVILFTLLMALEALSSEAGISLTEFAFETLEFVLIVVTAAGISHLLHRIRIREKEHKALAHELQVAREQGRKWRDKVTLHVCGLRCAMDDQFESWGMTKAEKEVGLLILKGLSHKEIANFRGTSEATVRQQAQTIYEKSELPGKSALLSFFLGDLFASQSADG